MCSICSLGGREAPYTSHLAQTTYASSHIPPQTNRLAASQWKDAGLTNDLLPLQCLCLISRHPYVVALSRYDQGKLTKLTQLPFLLLFLGNGNYDSYYLWNCSVVSTSPHRRRCWFMCVVCALVSSHSGDMQLRWTQDPTLSEQL